MGRWNNPIMLGKTNVMVFIDGDHIRRYTKEKYDNDVIAYDTLGRSLASAVSGGSYYNLIRIYYYDAVPDLRDAEKIVDTTQKQKVKERIEQILKTQNEYFDKIHSQEFVTIAKGHLQVLAEGEPRQKGVDILMSIDMLTSAFERQYDWAVLVAGDSDFLPLVEAVKHTGCNILGVYWKQHVARELVNAFDRRYELDSLNFSANGFLIS